MRESERVKPVCVLVGPEHHSEPSRWSRCGCGLGHWLSLCRPQCLPRKLEIIPTPWRCCKGEKVKLLLFSKPDSRFRTSPKTAFSGNPLAPSTRSRSVPSGRTHQFELTCVASFFHGIGTLCVWYPDQAAALSILKRGWACLCFWAESICSPKGWTLILKNISTFPQYGFFTEELILASVSHPWMGSGLCPEHSKCLTLPGPLQLPASQGC